MLYIYCGMEPDLLGVVSPPALAWEKDMADGSGGTGILGVIVGAAIVIAVGLYAFGGFPGAGGKATTVNINPPAVTGSK